MGFLNRIIRVGFSEKMAFEQRLDKGEGANHGDTCREKILVLSQMIKDCKEVSVARAKLARRKVVEDSQR